MGVTVTVISGWTSLKAAIRLSQLEASVKPPMLKDHRLMLTASPVGASVLGASVLEKLPPASLIVDLASRPGGTDFAAAAALGHTALHALSLPGKCAPETAGEFVARAVLGILAERGQAAPAAKEAEG